MPDFQARFTAGTTLERWEDPPLGGRPSRINPFVGGPHRYRRVELGTEVTISAVVAGVTAPLDAALGGRLFLGWFAEWPAARPTVTSPPGQSSVRRFTPSAFGHYTYVLRRQGGGGVILHLEVAGS
jgi:hypothetical protein